MVLARENRSIWRITRFSATSINSILSDPGSNSAFRGQGPATHRLNHGTALEYGNVNNFTSQKTPSIAVNAVGSNRFLVLELYETLRIRRFLMFFQ
jgi:hypothetical protein